MVPVSTLLETARLKLLGWLRGVPCETHTLLDRRFALCAASLEQTRRELRALEELLGKELAKRVTEHIGHAVAVAVRRDITRAVRNVYEVVGAQLDTPVTVEVSVDALRWLDPQSVERIVLDEWKEMSAARLTARCVTEMCTPMTRSRRAIDIRVPELGYRHVIDED